LRLHPPARSANVLDDCGKLHSPPQFYNVCSAGYYACPSACVALLRCHFFALRSYRSLDARDAALALQAPRAHYYAGLKLERDASACHYLLLGRVQQNAGDTIAFSCLLRSHIPWRGQLLCRLTDAREHAEEPRFVYCYCLITTLPLFHYTTLASHANIPLCLLVVLYSWVATGAVVSSAGVTTDRQPIKLLGWADLLPSRASTCNLVALDQAVYASRRGRLWHSGCTLTLEDLHHSSHGVFGRRLTLGACPAYAALAGLLPQHATYNTKNFL